MSCALPGGLLAVTASLGFFACSSARESGDSRSGPPATQATFASTANEAARDRSCPTRNAKVLLHNRQAAVYEKPGIPPFACSSHDAGHPISIGGEDRGLPPLMDLNGLVVGAVTGSSEDGLSLVAFSITNASDPDPQPDVDFDYEPDHPMRFGSLRVSRRGSLVWIGCKLPHKLWRYVGDVSSRPNCVKPGSNVDAVYYATPGTDRLRVLDRGAQIDPRSLRRQGNTVSWIRGGRRHTARVK